MLARPLRWLLISVTITTAAACGADTVRPAPEAGGDLPARAAPLLEAHDALLEFARMVASGDDEAAAARWPEVDETVDRALDGTVGRDTTGLTPAQRSTLTGFEGGLRLARDAWSEVHDAITGGDPGARERAAGTASDRMRHLESLRSGLE